MEDLSLLGRTLRYAIVKFFCNIYGLVISLQANSIVWILYVLSQQPEWQDRLRCEIKEADIAANIAGVDSIDYDRLPFLNAIIKVRTQSLKISYMSAKCSLTSLI